MGCTLSVQVRFPGGPPVVSPGQVAPNNKKRIEPNYDGIVPGSSGAKLGLMKQSSFAIGRGSDYEKMRPQAKTLKTVAADKTIFDVRTDHGTHAAHFHQLGPNGDAKAEEAAGCEPYSKRAASSYACCVLTRLCETVLHSAPEG